MTAEVNSSKDAYGTGIRSDICQVWDFNDKGGGRGLQNLENELKCMQSEGGMACREVTAEVNSKDAYGTGICSDICQVWDFND